MNLGLGTLSELKTQLLADSLRASTDYDPTLAALGRGVASLFETRCRRKFGRVEGDVFECSADRIHLVLPRYPVEAITKVELRESLADGWVDLGEVGTVVENFASDSGLVMLSTQPSMLNAARLRLTFTGGYWFDALEPADAGYPAAKPATAAERPADLLHAWLLQCEDVWRKQDKLGTAIAEKPATDATIGQVQLVPAVVDTLRDYVRYTLS